MAAAAPTTIISFPPQNVLLHYLSSNQEVLSCFSNNEKITQIYVKAIALQFGSSKAFEADVKETIYQTLLISNCPNAKNVTRVFANALKANMTSPKCKYLSKGEILNHFKREKALKSGSVDSQFLEEVAELFADSPVGSISITDIKNILDKYEYPKVFAQQLIEACSDVLQGCITYELPIKDEIVNRLLKEESLNNQSFAEKFINEFAEKVASKIEDNKPANDDTKVVIVNSMTEKELLSTIRTELIVTGCSSHLADSLQEVVIQTLINAILS